jgi:hypothetical protein
LFPRSGVGKNHDVIYSFRAYCEERGLINSNRMLMLSASSAVDVSTDSAGLLSFDVARVDPSGVVDRRDAPDFCRIGEAIEPADRFCSCTD